MEKVSPAPKDLASINAGNYRLDGEGRALYWAPYRKKYEEVRTKLTPGQQLTSEDGVDIAMIGNSTLIWTALDLKSRDREPLGTVLYPGKSAHIDFTNSLDPNTTADDIDLDMICDAVVGREKARRTDHVYATTMQDIESAGYRVFWTPQENHPLHARLVHASQMTQDAPRDLSRRQKEEFVKVWKKIK